jgi:hypothetical protein
MSNIASIHGYSVQYHNGEPMIEDLELAKRLGYENPYNIRKLVRSMMEAGQLSHEVLSRRIRQPEADDKEQHSES